eukprot:3107569-Amphidinium_carterae.1
MTWHNHAPVPHRWVHVSLFGHASLGVRPCDSWSMCRRGVNVSQLTISGCEDQSEWKIYSV